LVNLEHLNLSNNNLDEIPVEFYKLSNLKYLNLSNNNLKYVTIINVIKYNNNNHY